MKTMFYLKCDEVLFDLKGFISEFEYVLVEVNEKGIPQKELGFNRRGEIIHIYPSNKFKFGKYGIFDSNIFETNSIKNDINKEEFYQFWNNITL